MINHMSTKLAIFQLQYIGYDKYITAVVLENTFLAVNQHVYGFRM